MTLFLSCPKGCAISDLRLTRFKTSPLPGKMPFRVKLFGVNPGYRLECGERAAVRSSANH